MNPRVSGEFTGHGGHVLDELEQQTGKRFYFEGSEGLALDHFAVTFEGTSSEVLERAVPFRVGDELLVEIVEPHMYEADYGVAKIDGYIISVRDGARLVGERLMVRLEQVDRTAAIAVPLDGTPPTGEADDDVQSAPRRRGRRGGRRRSAEKEPAPEQA
jgi:ribonuclease G